MFYFLDKATMLSFQWALYGSARTSTFNCLYQQRTNTESISRFYFLQEQLLHV